MIVLVIFGGVTAACAAHGFGGLSLALGAVSAGAYYWFDVKRRPHVPCRPCKGSGTNYSRVGGGMLRRPFGKCWCCKGTKSHTRFAARILTPGQYRAIRQGREGRNYWT